ncbi:MAG: hypothetical protein ACTSWN_15830, partial [Promethearchaeota archaeon]
KPLESTSIFYYNDPVWADEQFEIRGWVLNASETIALNGYVVNITVYNASSPSDILWTQNRTTSGQGNFTTGIIGPFNIDELNVSVRLYQNYIYQENFTNHSINLYRNVTFTAAADMTVSQYPGQPLIIHVFANKTFAGFPTQPLERNITFNFNGLGEIEHEPVVPGEYYFQYTPPSNLAPGNYQFVIYIKEFNNNSLYLVNQTFSVNLKPLEDVTINFTNPPVWNDENLEIAGWVLNTSDLTPLNGYTLNISTYNLTNPTIIYWTANVTTTGQGNFTTGPAISPAFQDELGIRIQFYQQYIYAEKIVTGNAKLLKNASFNLSGGVPTEIYPGQPFPIFGSCFANWSGTVVGPVKNKAFNFYWNDTFVETWTTDNFGSFNFQYTPAFDLSPGVYSFKLELSDFNRTGYNVNTTYFVLVRGLMNVSIKYNTSWSAIFYNEPFSIAGSVTNTSNIAYPYILNLTGFRVLAQFTDGVVTVNSTDVYTDDFGDFTINIPDDFLYLNNLDPSNISVTILSDYHYIFNNGSSAPRTLKVFTRFDFVPDPVFLTATHYVGQYIHVLGTVFGNYSGEVRPLPYATFTYYWNGNFSGYLGLDDNGSVDFYLQTFFTDFTNNSNELLIELDVLFHPAIDPNTSYYFALKPLDQLTFNVEPKLHYAVFQNEDLIIDGQLSAQIGGISLILEIFYENGTVERYNSTKHDSTIYGLMESRNDGSFYFLLPGSKVTNQTSAISVIANQELQYNYSSLYYGPVPIQFVQNITFVDVNIENLDTVIKGQSLFIEGMVVANKGPNDNGTPIRDHEMIIIINNQHNVSISTNKSGGFSASIMIEGSVGSTYFVEFYMESEADPNANISCYSEVYQMEIVAAPNNTWVLWLIPPIVVGVILLGIVYVRIQKKKELARIRSYIQFKLDVVRELVKSGKFRESISYCFRILVDIATRHYNLEDISSGQTIKEFVTMLIREKTLPPSLGNKFIDAMNEGLYGPMKIDNSYVLKIVRLLGDLYQEITKDTSETFKL